MITNEKYEEVLRMLESGKMPDVYGADLKNFSVIKPADMYADAYAENVWHCTLDGLLSPIDLYYTKEEVALVLMRELFTKLDLEMKND